VFSNYMRITAAEKCFTCPDGDWQDLGQSLVVVEAKLFDFCWPLDLGKRTVTRGVHTRYPSSK
jgi:hypothetical protein